MTSFRDSQPDLKFKPKAKDDMAVDPFQDEFFKTESVGEFSHALLWETIQNSLDAKAGGSSEVRICISVFRKILLYMMKNTAHFSAALMNT